MAFEGPFAPYDWSTIRPRPPTNIRYLDRIGWLIEKLKPEAIAMEAYEQGHGRRGVRTMLLCRAIAALAQDRGISVHVYSRSQVQACFRSVGARTRDEIAEAVIRHVDVFRHRLPRRRRSWDNEDPRMSLFAAAALVITHFHVGANDLFEGLSSPA